MSAIILSLAVVTLAILTPSANADCNTLQHGVETFHFKKLCGKMYYVAYMAGIPVDTTCTITKVTCDNGDNVNLTTKIFRNGTLSKTVTSMLKDEGKGVISRDFNGIVRKQYVLTYAESFDGHFKLSMVLCDGKSENPTKKGILGSFKDADYTDELKNMNKMFPDGGLISLPNTCDIEKDFDY